MKQIRWLPILWLGIAIFSCRKDDVPPPVEKDSFKIAVVSDLHYMAPSLLANGAAEGTAFQAYLAQDPKLLQYSSHAFQTVMADLKQESPDILLVPGDLTKDGEQPNHQAVAAALAELRSKGTQVFVVPGNHDINNAKAAQFNGNTATPLPRTQVADFTTIYRNYGYDQTERDPASLSYLAKPFSKLWILAIDASKYETYGSNGDVAGGKIKDATLTWALARLALAKQEGAMVLGLMHHNIIEHYAGQSQVDPGYVLDNAGTAIRQLMDGGLRVVFTGHYHANDIASYSYNGNTLYEIETGSLVTFPNPYRLINFTDKKLDITTRTVDNISVALPGGVNFATYSENFLSMNLDRYFTDYQLPLFGVPAEMAASIAPLFRSAYMAHLAGDEEISGEKLSQINTLAGFSADLAGIALSLWTDPGVADNKHVIDLKEK